MRRKSYGRRKTRYGSRSRSRSRYGVRRRRRSSNSRGRSFGPPKIGYRM